MLGRLEPVGDGERKEKEREFWDPNKINLTAIVSCKVRPGYHSDTVVMTYNCRSPVSLTPLVLCQFWPLTVGLRITSSVALPTVGLASS